MDGDAGPEQHGCVHYRRGCKIRAPCCGEVFGCRHCHNEAKDSLEVSVHDRHVLPRHDIKLNRMCSKTVRTAEHVSANTSARNATSSTTISVPSSVFSGFVVAFPGISGVEEPISLRWVRHMQASSVKSFSDWWRREFLSLWQMWFSCPVCLRSACNMSDIWQKLDQQVAASPMPAIYQKKMVWILCNDCGVTSNVQFHILAHKCPGCSSYNTRQTRGDPAACSRV
ncbi:CHY-type/CTCHY-type/RING-type Zinc finger protein [Zea mays]|uniref:CHY-type/CTCHY-type/RING-type Zinc finger protein n=1 Tax=Zea mays TaxID=4577 RepID=A0A1D6JNJ1_MAIZE|nr:CHY-type/CTCHY-type/RING-type Zinc finger protein [Zea mays]